MMIKHIIDHLIVSTLNRIELDKPCATNYVKREIPTSGHCTGEVLLVSNYVDKQPEISFHIEFVDDFTLKTAHFAFLVRIPLFLFCPLCQMSLALTDVA